VVGPRGARARLLTAPPRYCFRQRGRLDAGALTMAAAAATTHGIQNYYSSKIDELEVRQRQRFPVLQHACRPPSAHRSR
jgi:hypothetical protein